MNTTVHRIIVILIMNFVISSCVSLPKAPQDADKRAKSFMPKKGYGNIYIFRNSFTARAVIFDIEINDKKSSELSAEGYHLFEFMPGPVKITVFSKEIRESMLIDVHEGHNYFLWVKPRGGLRYARASIEEINETEGKKKISNLRLLER